MSPRFELITGRYLHLELLGKSHRLYVEEAGQGIPLLCLHTAGSDARQYRGVLNDAPPTPFAFFRASHQSPSPILASLPQILHRLPSEIFPCLSLLAGEQAMKTAVTV